MRAKISAWILMLCMLLSFGTVQANGQFSDVSGESNGKTLSLISGLGIMKGYENGEFLPDQEITRAEFAEILVNILNLKSDGNGFNWNNTYLGDEESELELKLPVENKSVFYDVPISHWACESIRLVAEFGVMRGYEGYFEPDSPITYQEAVKTLLRLMGYGSLASVEGGYPSGYLKQAVRLGISAGKDVAPTQKLTRMQMALLFYSSLDVDVLIETVFGENREYTTREGETFLTNVMKVRKCRGILSATDLGSLNGTERLGQRQIRVDGMLLSVGEELDGIRDWIGREVDVYYRENQDDMKTVFYAELTGEEKVVQFDVERLSAYTGDGFEYWDNEGKPRRIRVSSGALLIYNGVVKESYTKEIFDFECGDICVVSGGSSRLGDIIYVNAFDTYYVSSVEKEPYRIVNKLTEGQFDAKNSMLKPELGQPDFICRITNRDGDSIDFDAINTGAVLNVRERDCFMDIRVSTASVSGKVNSVKTEGDIQYVEIEGNTFRISKSYLDSPSKTELRVGMSGTYYLDVFDRIIWVDAEVQSGGVAYLIHSAFEDGALSPALHLQYFDFNSEEVKEETIDYKVRFMNSRGEEGRVSPEEIAQNILGKNLVFTITKNKENKISKIEMPFDRDIGGKTGIYTMVETSEDSESENYYGNFVYKISAGVLGAQLFIDANTKVLHVPDDPGEFEQYRMIGTGDLRNSKTYRFKAYGSKASALRAEYLICFADGAAEQLNEDDRCMVVSEIQQGIDKDGEPIKILTGIQNGNEVSISAYYDEINVNGEGCTIFDISTDVFGTKDAEGNTVYYPIEAGDIIRFIADEATGNVVKCQTVWRAGEANPAWSEDAPLGHLAGSNGSFANGVLNGNPYALNSNGVPVANADKFHIGNLTFIEGFVTMKDGNYITVTTEDLADGSYDGSGYTRSYNAGKYTTTTITMEEQRFERAKNGSLADIRSFAEVGAECSRVLVVSKWGDPYQLFVINDEE